MPVNSEVADAVWTRYQWLRDHGHLEFVTTASKCDEFFRGKQWADEDLAYLQSPEVNRPALTINKIISTVSTVMGEHIFNRADTAFKPRNETATPDVATALTKVFLQISDNNQLPWTRSDVFCDGVIMGRGFYDVRLDFSDSLKGEIKIALLNPKNVIIDADADTYDPDDWGDVLISKWMSPLQLSLLYEDEDVEYLINNPASYSPYSLDAFDRKRDRFGDEDQNAIFVGDEDAGENQNVRYIRVIERQHRVLSKQEHFVDIEQGDMRPVPEDWERNRISQYLQSNPSVTTIKKVVPRIRWTVVAGEVALHDDWSPYSRFTVVPFFPHFRRGRTIGLVENLLGPQELLNKTSSQELHIVNTTANSGWKIKAGSLVNMSTSELEQRGATTGLVLELDDPANAEKIMPNPTPQGLDRISYKAEDHIKTISGVSDYMQGFAREDVAAKSVAINQRRGSANMARVSDNMLRTDWILGRNVLDLVQEFYTEQRLIRITTSKFMNQTEQIEVNRPTPEGKIVNDLTLGEYQVVVSSQPERDTLEESQFDEAVAMRKEIGVQIPDKYIVQASQLRNKSEIIEEMTGNQDSPAAQQAAELDRRAREAEVAALEAEVRVKQTEAQHKQAKAMNESREEQGPELEVRRMQAENALARERMQMEMQLKREEMEMEMQLKREEMGMKRQQMAQDLQLKRAKSIQDSALAQT